MNFIALEQVRHIAIPYEAMTMKKYKKILFISLLVSSLIYLFFSYQFRTHDENALLISFEFGVITVFCALIFDVILIVILGKKKKGSLSFWQWSVAMIIFLFCMTIANSYYLVSHNFIDGSLDSIWEILKLTFGIGILFSFFTVHKAWIKEKFSKKIDLEETTKIETQKKTNSLVFKESKKNHTC